MADSSNRIQRGFKPLYGPGQYKGYGEAAGRSVQKPNNKEAGSGANANGIAATPVIHRGESERDD